MPLELAVSHGRIYLNETIFDQGQTAEEKTELKQCSVSVFDREDGTLDASYREDESLGSMLVGVSPAEFYFLKARVEHSVIKLSIVRAGP